MGRGHENAGFVCEHCGREVTPVTDGSYRNHCPFCLYSKHVDVRPGDRASVCGGLMKPVGIKRSKKGFQIIHRCLRCRALRVNRIAEHTDQPDDLDAIVRLLQHPQRR